VPALREREEDISELANNFLQRFSRKHGIQHPGFSDRARLAMLAYSWPGNVRELQNTIERAVILTGENLAISFAALGLPELNPSSLPAFSAAPSDNQPATAAAAGPRGDPAPAPAPEPATRPAPDTADVVNEPPPAGPPPPAADEIIPLDEIEKRHILAALRHTSGNRTRAASMLGISIRTLRNKLQEYRAAGIVITGDDSPGE